VLEVLEAQRIDVELDALGLELLVHVRRLVLEVEVVREPGASSADDAKAEALVREVLGLGDLLDLRRGPVRDRDHAWTIGRILSACQVGRRTARLARSLSPPPGRVGRGGGRPGRPSSRAVRASGGTGPTRWRSSR